MEYQNENFNGAYDFRSRFHDGWQVKAHLHEYSELLYCKKGEGFVVVNGQAICLREKQLVWIPPNYIHEYACKSAEVVCAVFSNDLIPLFFKALEGRHFRVSAVNMAEMADVLESFHELRREDYLLVSGYLNLICAHVMAQSEFESKKHSDGILYQKVITYLSEHYAEDITLRKIAKLFGYNEKYLSHTLHELTGIHFRQLLAFYKIKHAKKLLEEERETDITTIAMNSGFSAINTFDRTFKEMTKMTPSEYRRSFEKSQ